MQPVKVDMTQGNIALIASGVAAGDQVVVDGQERLQQDTPVEVHNASQGGPAGAAPASGDSGSGGPEHKGEGKNKKQGKQS
jgi:multidrug efflux system membrane fusion protein